MGTTRQRVTFRMISVVVGLMPGIAGQAVAKPLKVGCAKTFALMGRAFAEANLKMLESGRR